MTTLVPPESSVQAPEVAGESRARLSVRASGDQPMAVELRELRKRFVARRAFGDILRRSRPLQHVDALTGVTLAVPAGCCFGILGLNGAGKSTLFRILSTLVLPDGGGATVSGLDVVEDAPAVRELLSSAGADERSLFWRLSAAENLRLYASLHGLRGAERAARIEEALSVVGLESAGSKMVGRFSSGLRQRLLLARALLSRPRVLLLDEPTRSLDPVAAREFREFIRRELVERQGCTVLLATHGADEAFSLCDAVAVLHEGRVVADGRAADLAADLGADRVVLWTSEPEHPVLATPAMLGGGVERLPTPLSLEEQVAMEPDAQWSPITLRVSGGAVGSAWLLGRLVEAGIPVARLEPLRPTLADLLGELTGGTDPDSVQGPTAVQVASHG